MGVSATPSGIAARLAYLRGLPATAGIVSVYLNTQWSDEHQRERTRVFLSGELRAAGRRERRRPTTSTGSSARHGP